MYRRGRIAPVVHHRRPHNIQLGSLEQWRRRLTPPVVRARVNPIDHGPDGLLGVD